MKVQQCTAPPKNQSIFPTTDWALELRQLLRPGAIVLVGVGNPLRSDDYVGSLVAKELAKRTKNSQRVTIIDAENSPENVLGKIAEKRAILTVFVDSVDAGLEPGSIILTDMTKTSYPFFTTHNLPLKMLGQILPEDSKIVLLGVQPGNVEIAGQISSNVRSAHDSIVQEMVKIFRELS